MPDSAEDVFASGIDLPRPFSITFQPIDDKCPLIQRTGRSPSLQKFCTLSPRSRTRKGVNLLGGTGSCPSVTRGKDNNSLLHSECLDQNQELTTKVTKDTKR